MKTVEYTLCTIWIINSTKIMKMELMGKLHAAGLLTERDSVYSEKVVGKY